MQHFSKTLIPNTMDRENSIQSVTTLTYLNYNFDRYGVDEFSANKHIKAIKHH